MILNTFKISHSFGGGGCWKISPKLTGGVEEGEGGCQKGPNPLTYKLWTCVHCQASRKCQEMLPCYCHYDKH